MIQELQDYCNRLETAIKNCLPEGWYVAIDGYFSNPNGIIIILEIIDEGKNYSKVSQTQFRTIADIIKHIHIWPNYEKYRKTVISKSLIHHFLRNSFVIFKPYSTGFLTEEYANKDIHEIFEHIIKNTLEDQCVTGIE